MCRRQILLATDESRWRYWQSRDSIRPVPASSPRGRSAGRGHQRFALRSSELQPLKKQMERVLARETSRAPLQITNAAGAQSSALSQFFLRQPSGDAVAP